MPNLDENFFFDFFRFHGWGNQKLLRLSENLSDEALDASVPLGPGSLRATFVHMIGAQQIWLDRWKNRPSGPFPTGEDWSIEKIRSELDSVDRELDEFLKASSVSGFGQAIEYANLKGERHRHRLSDLLLHVLNHAVHHRSQLLHFLKRQGQTIPGGLDYIFFKLAYPTVLQRRDLADKCRAFGIETGSEASPFLLPSIELIVRYQSYGDWATRRIFEGARSLSDEQLDRDWTMGRGTLRKTLLHLYDAESFWQPIWQDQPLPFPSSSIETSIESLATKWEFLSEKRSRLVEQIGQAGIDKTVISDFGTGPLQFRIAESMIQLCVHGTLHRAQANNMLRSLGRAVEPLDYIVYLRDRLTEAT